MEIAERFPTNNGISLLVLKIGAEIPEIHSIIVDDEKKQKEINIAQQLQRVPPENLDLPLMLYRPYDVLYGGKRISVVNPYDGANNLIKERYLIDAEKLHPRVKPVGDEVYLGVGDEMLQGKIFIHKDRLIFVLKSRQSLLVLTIEGGRKIRDVCYFMHRQHFIPEALNQAGGEGK